MGWNTLSPKPLCLGMNDMERQTIISLTNLQIEMDRTFVGSDYIARQARQGSGGFFISCPIIKREFIEWIETYFKCRLENVQYDDQHSEYVKAFFEEVKA